MAPNPRPKSLPVATMTTGNDDVDYVKTVAEIGSGLFLVEKMLKIFRLWPKDTQTKTNGEITLLLRSLRRIETRIDHIAERVETLETRFPA